MNEQHNPAAELIRNIPISKLRESPFNPRTSYPEAELQELAESIKSQGVMQPLVARPLTDEQAHIEHEFELIFGHRRFRASQIAELAEVPVILRPMSDKQAAIAQSHENAKRRDVNAVEEADSFMHLQAVHGMSAEDIAREVGKSKSYVYGRLKMATMAPAVRLSVEQYALPAEIALELARIHSHTLQTRSLPLLYDYKWVGANQVRDGWISYRKAAALLRQRFSIRLKDAKFDTTQHLLGSTLASCCEICPKRAGNDPELRDELEADVCTDKACFDDKTAAHETAEFEALAASTKAAMDKANEKHRQQQHFFANQNQLVMDEQAQTASTPTSSCASADGGREEQAPMLVGRPQIPFEDLPPEVQAVRGHESWMAIKRAIMAKACGTERTANDLRLIITAWLDPYEDISPVIFELMGWPDDALGTMHGEDVEFVLDVLPKLGADELGRLLMLLVLDSEQWSIRGQDMDDQRRTLATRFGVDILNPSASTPTPGCAGADEGAGAAASSALGLPLDSTAGQDNEEQPTATAEDSSLLTAAHAAGEPAEVVA